MLNCLRMDFFRMIHSKTTWIFTAIVVVSAAMTTGLMGYMGSDAFKDAYFSAQSAAEMGNFSMGLSVGGNAPSAQEISQAATPLAVLTGGNILSYFGSVFVSGGFITIMTSLYAALFLSSEFDSGFAKNIFSAQVGRGAFFASKIVALLAAAFVICTLAFGMLFLGSLVIGMKLEFVAPLDFALWFALVVLVAFSFEMLVALVVWFTRSKVTGILVAVFVGGAIVYQIIALICSLIPALKSVPDFLLTGCMQSLGKATEVFGPLGATHIALVGLTFAAVCAVGSILALKKRDI